MKYETKYIIFSIIMSLTMFCGGYCSGYLRSHRAECSAITVLQQRVDAQQRESQEHVERLQSEIRQLRDNNARAEQIVGSMGDQLAGNDGTIQSTIGLIKKLRIQMQSLNDIYTDCSSSSDYCDGVNN